MVAREKKLTQLVETQCEIAEPSLRVQIRIMYRKSCHAGPEWDHQRAAVEKVERPKVVAHNPQTRKSLERERSVRDKRSVKNSTEENE